MRINKVRYLLLAVLFGVVLLYYYYPCFAHKFSRLPKNVEKEIDSREKTVLYIFRQPCGGCPDGNFLFSLRKRNDILFVVPSDFNPVDIENLKNAFSLSGLIINGNKETEDFLKKLAKCLKAKNWEKNYVVEIKRNKIWKVKQF